MSIQSFKNRVKHLLGRAYSPPLETKREVEHLGGEYGSWHLAKGSLNRDSVVYSVGVGQDVSFDLEIMKLYAVTVHAFDPTPSTIEWVKTQSLPDSFTMHPYGLADFDGETTFFAPTTPGFVSHTMIESAHDAGAKEYQVPMKRLATIMSELGHDRIDLLKMDIEGAEYSVIEDMAKSGILPRQLLVEFHHRFAGIGMGKTRSAHATLMRLGYKLFSVSDTAEEFGFLLS